MKEIPLGNGLNAKVDEEDYEWLSTYSWYAYYDSERGMTYAAHYTPSGRRVFMHDVIMASIHSKTSRGIELNRFFWEKKNGHKKASAA